MKHRAIAAIAATFLSANMASAIVINDDAGMSTALALADPFNSVVSLSRDTTIANSFCTGSLIAPTVIVTAFHCVDDGPGVVSPGSFNVLGTQGDGTVTQTSAVTSIAGLNPPYTTLLDGSDIAILTLAVAFSGTPLRFAEEVTVGQEATMIGYGWNGLGSTGHEYTDDGQRWGATNIIDAVGEAAEAGPGTANIISTDFDKSDGTTSYTGTNAALPNEGTTAPGDSGGPLLVWLQNEWLIGGVLSGGTTGNSVYGDVSWWTSTFSPEARAFIEDAGGQYAVAAVPLPAGVWLLLGGIGGLAALRRRRARAA